MTDDEIGGLVVDTGLDRDEIAKLVYDTWVKAVDGPDFLSFKELPYVSHGDYDGVYAVADALIAKAATALASLVRRLREALEPFAQFAEFHDGPNGLQPKPRPELVWLRPSPGYPPITEADLQRARAAAAAADTVREKTIEETDELVEKVAKAIWSAFPDGDSPPWESLSDESKYACCVEARAAIRALKTPAPDQVVDVNEVIPSAPALSQEREPDTWPGREAEARRLGIKP